MQKYDYQDYLIIGDFNAVYDRRQNRKSVNKKDKTGKLLPKPFLLLAEEAYLVDAWRTKYPNTSDFMYYSYRHMSWFRIDMCWMTLELMKEMEETEILPGTFVDHKPLCLIVKDYIKKLWHFNTIHLQNKDFKIEVDKEIKYFFKQNIQEETFINTVWEASKAFFRGLTIRFGIRQGKEKSQKFKDLKEKLKKRR